MRPDDFYLEQIVPGLGAPCLNVDLLEQLRRGPVPEYDDVEAAPALARLVHDELEEFGTAGNVSMTNDEMRDALRALGVVVGRLGVKGFNPQFRDFGTFRSWWLREGAANSWQARRELLYGVFDPLHDQLAILEQRSFDATLIDPITSHPRTGWAEVDVEIAELRRHFQNARTPQDYRHVGLDCVAITEALSRELYNPAIHLRDGEDEPPVAKTKQRLDRYIDDAVPGADNAALRKVSKAVIEFAQDVKHSNTPTRRDAGIAADAVIQLANLLRRLAESD